MARVMMVNPSVPSEWFEVRRMGVNWDTDARLVKGI